VKDLFNLTGVTEANVLDVGGIIKDGYVELKE